MGSTWPLLELPRPSKSPVGDHAPLFIDDWMRAEHLTKVGPIRYSLLPAMKLKTRSMWGTSFTREVEIKNVRVENEEAGFLRDCMRIHRLVLPEQHPFC